MSLGSRQAGRTNDNEGWRILTIRRHAMTQEGEMGFPAMAELLLPAVLAALMVAAAISDARRYIIPNWLCLAVAGGWLILMLTEYALADGGARLYGDVWRQSWSAVLVAGLVFAGATGLFAAGVMGGGDVKLLGAVALWAGPQLVIMFLFITSLVGGGVSLGVLAREKARANATTSPIVNTLSSTMSAPKVPYGLGIAAGGLYVAWVLGLRAGLIG